MCIGFALGGHFVVDPSCANFPAQEDPFHPLQPVVCNFSYLSCESITFKAKNVNAGTVEKGQCTGRGCADKLC